MEDERHRANLQRLTNQSKGLVEHASDMGVHAMVVLTHQDMRTEVTDNIAGQSLPAQTPSGPVQIPVVQIMVAIVGKSHPELTS